MVFQHTSAASNHERQSVSSGLASSYFWGGIARRLCDMGTIALPAKVSPWLAKFWKGFGMVVAGRKAVLGVSFITTSCTLVGQKGAIDYYAAWVWSSVAPTTGEDSSCTFTDQKWWDDFPQASAPRLEPAIPRWQQSASHGTQRL